MFAIMEYYSAIKKKLCRLQENDGDHHVKRNKPEKYCVFFHMGNVELKKKKGQGKRDDGEQSMIKVQYIHISKVHNEPIKNLFKKGGYAGGKRNKKE
jgi:hypothetical protein